MTINTTEVTYSLTAAQIDALRTMGFEPISGTTELTPQQKGAQTRAKNKEIKMLAEAAKHKLPENVGKAKPTVQHLGTVTEWPKDMGLCEGSTFEKINRNGNLCWYIVLDAKAFAKGDSKGHGFNQKPKK